jgi:hypothetical protein
MVVDRSTVTLSARSGLAKSSRIWSVSRAARIVSVALPDSSAFDGAQRRASP